MVLLSCYKWSMSELDRIVRQMAQAVEGDAWHGPALMEVLEGVHAVVAAAKPVAGAHSIWEIMLHLAGTQDLLTRRLAGDAMPLSDEEDWPPIIKASEDAWRATVDAYLAGERRLREAVTAFAEALLDEPLIRGGSSAYNNLHGYIQHVLYHTGQIALLTKAAQRARESRPEWRPG